MHKTTYITNNGITMIIETFKGREIMNRCRFEIDLYDLPSQLSTIELLTKAIEVLQEKKNEFLNT